MASQKVDIEAKMSFPSVRFKTGPTIRPAGHSRASNSSFYSMVEISKDVQQKDSWSIPMPLQRGLSLSGQEHQIDEVSDSISDDAPLVDWLPPGKRSRRNFSSPRAGLACDDLLNADVDMISRLG